MNSVERLVLQMIGENIDSPDVFTPESDDFLQVRDSIADAVEEIAAITGSVEKTYYIPIRADKTYYRLDTTSGTIAWITNIRTFSTQWRLEQTDLVKLRNYNPGWESDNGIPRSYFPVGLNYIGVWPKSSSDTDMMEVQAVIIPNRYKEDTDRLEMRKSLDWAAAHYAIGEYYAGRGDAQSAREHHAKYLQLVGIDMPYRSAAEYQYRMKPDKEPWPKATG